MGRKTHKQPTDRKTIQVIPEPSKTLTDVRTASTAAYVNQSATSDKITKMAARRLLGEHSSDDADWTATYQEQPYTNGAPIVQLESELNTARPDTTHRHFEVHNIPSQGHANPWTEPPVHAHRPRTPAIPEYPTATDSSQDSEQMDEAIEALCQPAAAIRRQAQDALDRMQPQRNRTSAAQPLDEAQQAPTIEDEEYDMVPQDIRNLPPMVFTGKSTLTAKRFLAQMDRYLRKAGVDTEVEMVDQLHRYLSDEVRTSLMNVLTSETDYDYAAQAEFLLHW